MGKKQHFAIVPDKLIAKRDPVRLQIYCELYMMEVSNQRYNLRHFAEDRDISYNIAYKLLRIVRETLGNSRKKKRPDKQSEKNDKKLAKNNRYDAEKHEVEQFKTEKNEKKSENSDKQGQYHVEPVGISEALKLELELELETNERPAEKNILSRSELMAMRESDRNEYVRKNYEALKKAGII